MKTTTKPAQAKLNLCETNTMKRNVLLHTAVLALSGVIAAQAAVYTFDGLTAGPLHGQDNWTASGNALIETALDPGFGLVLNNASDGYPEAASSRINDATFSIPTLSGPRAAISFDFRIDNTAADVAAAMLTLAEPDHGWSDEGKIGIAYHSSYDQLLVVRADGT